MVLWGRCRWGACMRKARPPDACDEIVIALKTKTAFAWVRWGEPLVFLL